MIELDL